MKSLKVIVVLILLSSLAEAKESEARRSIRGLIEVEKGAKEGGELFLTVTAVGGNLVPVTQPGAKKEIIPAEDIKIISLGRFYGRTKDFSLLLKKGSFQLGCIVKKADPPCKEITRNGEKRIVSCIPTKDDLVCAGTTIEVNDKDLDAIKIPLGLPDKGDS